MKPRRDGTDLVESDPTPQPPIAYTVERFAALIPGISERTVRDWCAAGTIPATKIGSRWIIPAAAVEHLLNGPAPDNVTPLPLK